MSKTGWTIIAFAFALLGTGCGSSSSAPLAQASCSSGYVLDNGGCVLVSGLAGSLDGSCLPITGPIEFYGSGVDINSSDELYGGTSPSSSAYGTMGVGTEAAVSGTPFTGGCTGAYSASIQMSIPEVSGGYVSASTALSGSLTIGPYLQEVIAEDAYGSSYGESSDGRPCVVSGIAVQGQLLTYESQFTGTVYLYLNGTSHGYELAF